MITKGVSKSIVSRELPNGWQTITANVNVAKEFRINTESLDLFLAKAYHPETGCIIGSAKWSSDKKIYIPLEMIESRWIQAADWVIKLNFDNTIKVNRVLEKHGDFLNKLFLLIERIVSFDNEGIAIESWKEFQIALMQLECFDCFRGIPYINNSWIKGYLKAWRSRLKALKENRNPFKTKYCDDPYIEHYLTRAFYYKNCSIPFYRNYWKPFLTSFSKYITDLDKNPYIKHSYVEGNKLVFQVGKGNSPKNKRKFDLY